MAYAIFHEDYVGKPEAAVLYYFSDGDRSAKLLATLIYENLGFGRDIPFQLLEFASGYGRVTRHWNMGSDASVTTCDIHAAAVEFNRRELGFDPCRRQRLQSLLNFHRITMSSSAYRF